jgi:hypothetical protein
MSGFQIRKLKESENVQDPAREIKGEDFKMDY